MSLHSLNGPARMILAGQVLLVLCCVFYLWWWSMAFRPGVSVPRVTGRAGVLLAVTAAYGLGGLVLNMLGLNTIPHGAPRFGGGWLLAGGIAVYAALLLITGVGLHRPVTSELFLITGWAVLELSVCSTLQAAGCFSLPCLYGLTAAIAAAFAASMVCYVLYYRLPAQAGFYSGMVPLATEAVCMAAVAAALAL